MQESVIDLSRTVAALCAEHPGVAEILRSLGFADITKPGMLATAGRFMTIPKGAALKKIDLETIKDAFKAQGYIVKEELE